MVIPGTDGVVHADVQCYRCQQRGHYASQCPTQTEQETSGNGRNVQLVQIAESNNTEVEDPVSYELSFTQIAKPVPDETSNFINNYWLLLDSQSSISVYNNPDYMTNVQKSYLPVKAHTNGGSQESYKFGDSKYFGSVWFNPESLANILSLAQVRKYCRVTMDTEFEPAMVVHLSDGKEIKFIEYKNGLYYHDVRSGVLDKYLVTSRENVTDYLLMKTVEENKKLFTRK